MLNGYDIVESIREQVVKLKTIYESDKRKIANICDPIDEELQRQYTELTKKITLIDYILNIIDKTVDNFRRID